MVEYRCSIWMIVKKDLDGLYHHISPEGCHWRIDLHQSQCQNVGTVSQGKTEQFLDLCLISSFGQTQKGIGQLKTFPG